MTRICQYFLPILYLLSAGLSADQPASDARPTLFAEQSDPIPVFIEGEDNIRFSVTVNLQCHEETPEVALNLMVADTVVTIKPEEAASNDMPIETFIDVPMKQLTGLQPETICKRTSKTLTEPMPIIRLKGAFSVQIEARCNNQTAASRALALPLSVDIGCEKTQDAEELAQVLTEEL